MKLQQRIELTQTALIGQAVGDAFGVPVEFLSRREVQELDLRDMAGMDSKCPFNSRWGRLIPKGSWSDDTSMTIASMASFIRNEGRIVYEDQLEQFCRWWDKGKYCCLDYPFGLGGNVAASLERYRRGTAALECGGKGMMDNGNGALMRILPFSLYCIFNDLSGFDMAAVTGCASSITHGHEISRLCCYIWTAFLKTLAEGAEPAEAIDYVESLEYQKGYSIQTVAAVSFITGKKTRTLTPRDIGETGYVVDTLYSALYSVYHGNDYETSILNAVNLGYDTDTVAAVTGMAAGILYGKNSIPVRWLNDLRKREYLEDIARNFAACFSRNAQTDT